MSISDEIRRIDNHLIYTPEHDAILRDIGIYCMSRARNDDVAADKMLLVLESLSLEHHELFKILYEGGNNEPCEKNQGTEKSVRVRIS